MKRTKYVVSLYLIILFTFFSTGLAYGAENLNEVRNLIKTRYYQDVGDEVLNKKSVQEMVQALNDPYSTYMEPELFKDFLDSLDGKYVGVGMYINEFKDRVQVVNPMPGSPRKRSV